jgi:UDP-glucuronate decarboxylase
MKNILVTGGAGFIGFNLSKKLLENGHKVICVDNLITGNLQNVKDLEKFPNFTFIEKNISDPSILEIEELRKLDKIYDMACPASPVDFSKIPLEILATCSVGVKNLLELAKKNNARILHASTSEVYGDPKEHPQKESYWGHANPYGPRACYDEGKRFAESLIYNYREKYNLNTAIVRIFNTYGPHMRPDDGRVVSNFINQALSNKSITVYGNGSQTRSFCFIEDEVDGIIKLMESKESGPINVGNPHEFTIKELAEKVINLIPNTSSKIIFNDLPKDDPAQRRPDISLAKEKLGWEPKIELEEGLKETIIYFQSIP